MREPDTKGRPHVCMNEVRLRFGLCGKAVLAQGSVLPCSAFQVEFGANIPVGTLTLLSRKFGGNDKAIRECVLEARRFTGPDW